MSEVRNWLESIALGQYAYIFEANHLEMDLLSQVDDNLLKDIGVSSAGHRLGIRNGIAKFAGVNRPVPESNVTETSTKTPVPSRSAATSR